MIEFFSIKIHISIYKETSLFFKHLYWSIIALQMVCKFLLYNKVNQLYIYNIIIFCYS